MSRVQARLDELGLELPPPPKALAAYAPTVVADGWIYTAGQLPLRDGALTAAGLVGRDVDEEAAAGAAATAALNGLAAIADAIGDLDRLRLVKVTGFVASAPGYTGQPVVLNGASMLLADVLGPCGMHARSAVGVAALPLGAAVEVELIGRVAEGGACAGA